MNCNIERFPWMANWRRDYFPRSVEIQCRCWNTLTKNMRSPSMHVIPGLEGTIFNIEQLHYLCIKQSSGILFYFLLTSIDIDGRQCIFQVCISIHILHLVFRPNAISTRYVTIYVWLALHLSSNSHPKIPVKQLPCVKFPQILLVNFCHLL